MTKTSIYRLFFSCSYKHHEVHTAFEYRFFGFNDGFFKKLWRMLRKQMIALKIVNGTNHWFSYDSLDNIYIERMFLK